jgi:hypothetical protein
VSTHLRAGSCRRASIWRSASSVARLVRPKTPVTLASRSQWETPVAVQIDALMEWRADPNALDRPFTGRTALLLIRRLVHDRDRAMSLFDFEYILEMYKPSEKRRWVTLRCPCFTTTAWSASSTWSRPQCWDAHRQRLARGCALHPGDAPTWDRDRMLAAWLGLRSPRVTSHAFDATSRRSDDVKTRTDHFRSAAAGDWVSATLYCAPGKLSRRSGRVSSRPLTRWPRRRHSLPRRSGRCEEFTHPVQVSGIEGVEQVRCDVDG